MGTGAGTLTLYLPAAGLHTYGGDTTINGGVLKLGQEDVIPYGAGRGGVVIGEGGTLQLYRDSQTVNSLSGAGTVVNSGAPRNLTVGASGASSDSSFSGTISGVIELDKDGTGTLTLSGTNDYTQATLISGGKLKLGGNNALPTNTSVTVETSGTLDLNGYSQEVASLDGGGIVDNTTAGGPFTLKVPSGTFSGVIKNTAGTLALIKNSYATLTLSGVNTYTGDTTVSDGTLLVNGSLAAGSAVTVAAGKTLGGTGTVAGLVTVNGIVSPGASVGTLTTGAETWNGGGSYTVEMSKAGTQLLPGTPGTDWDFLSTSGIASGIAVAATSGNEFTIKLVSVDAVSDFDSTQAYSWAITQGGASNFDATAFTIDTSDFTPLSNKNDRFSVAYVEGSIQLDYTPPGTRTWSGDGLLNGDPDPSWSNPDNWVEGTVPSDGDSLVFPAKFDGEDITNLAPYNDLPTTGDESLSSIASVTFSAADYEVTGDTMLTLNDGAISMTVGGGTSTWAIPTVVESSKTLTLWAFGGGELQIGDVVDDVASGGVSGAGSLTAGDLEDGGGSVTLSGSNTYTGGTTIINGWLFQGSETALPIGGDVTVDLSDSEVEDSSGLDLDGFDAIIGDLSGDGTVDNGGDDVVLTVASGEFSGIITDYSQEPTPGGSLSLTKTGSGDLTLSGENTYAGDTTISDGAIKLGAHDAIPYGTGAGAVLIGTDGTLDLNGYSQTVNGLLDAGDDDAGTVDNTGSGASTLTVNDVDGWYGPDVFSGVITDSGTGSLALTKAGSGVLVLFGANTYTGATTVEEGTLLVNGALAAGSAATVANGATLGGTGTVAGLVTVIGFLAPGASPDAIGTLATGAETWADGGTYTVDIDDATGTAGTNWDQLVISGDLTATGPFVVNLVSADDEQLLHFDATVSYEWPIATFTGAEHDVAANVSVIQKQFSPEYLAGGTFSVMVEGQAVYLVFTPGSGQTNKLVFTQQPGGGTAGAAWATDKQPIVTVQDADGNTVTDSTAVITLAITTGTTDAALTCTANPQTASSGVATFADCSIDKAGTTYVLTATATGLTPAVSTPAFTIGSNTAITAFSFTSPAATGVINETTHTIAVTVPLGTDVTGLVATFTTTGASVAVGVAPQDSGATPNDFTNPVTYTVTAGSSTQDYVVTVTIGGGPTQTILFTSSPPVVASVGDTYTPTATGGASGNPVVFTIDAASADVCSISDGVVTFLAAGTCTIDANQAGDASHDPAPQVQQSVTIGDGPTPGGPTVTSVSPAWGPAGGGTLVTFNGTGFTSDASVSFGPTPALFVTIDASTGTGTAVSPGGYGLVHVIVTTAAGTSATSAANAFLFFTLPPAPPNPPRPPVKPVGPPFIPPGEGPSTPGATPTPEPSPTPTLTPTGGPTLTLTPATTAITWGDSVTLTASLDAGGVAAGAGTGAGAGQPIAFERSTDGVTWASIGTATTGTDGTASLTFRPQKNAQYRATFGGTTDLSAATSAVVSVLVRQTVILPAARVSAPLVLYLGSTATFTATIRPIGPGFPLARVTFVVFQKSGTGWTTISTDTVAASASGIAFLRYAPETRGTWSVVAYAQATTANEASAMSERAVFSVR